MELLNNLKWRYATKKFDPTKKIKEEDLEEIMEAVQLSASSYGLQLYKIFIVEDDEIRKKLKEAAMGQSQVTDSSQIFLFASYYEVKPEHIDEFIKRTAKIRDIDIKDLEGFGDMMKNSIAKKTQKETEEWTSRQTYIALGTLLAACAELKIDACPMEGFDTDQFDEILGLKEQGLTATVMATIGYRSENDAYQHLAKVRKPIEQLYETI